MLLATTLCFAAAGDADRLLVLPPEDAMLVVSVAGVDEIRRRAAANAWWRLAQDDALRPLREELGGLLTKGLEEELADESDGARRIADPRAWLGGIHGAAIAYMVLDGEAPGGGLFLEPGEEHERFDELWNLVLEESRKRASESTQEYQGCELVLLEREEEDGSWLTIFLEVAGVRGLVGGERREFVLELAQGGIDRLLGKDPSPGFRANASLAAARAAAGDARALEVFMDVSSFVRFVLAEAHREAAQQPDTVPSEEERARTAKLLERFGVSGMRYAYAAADLGEDERFDLSFSLHLPAGSLLQQASTFLRPAPRDLVALAPTDSISVMAGGFDLAGFWQFVRGAVAELDPEARAQLDAGLEGLRTGMGIDLEQDLLQQVRGEFVNFSVRIPEDEVPAGLVDVLGEEARAAMAMGEAYLVRLGDGTVVEELAERVLELTGAAALVEEEEYQGHWVQSLVQEGVGLHWCFTDELFIAAQTPTPLRAALARVGATDQPSILADERYRSAFERHAGSAVVSVGDARVVVEGGLSALRLVLGMGADAASDPEAAEVMSRLVQHLPEPSIAARYLDGVITQIIEVGPESIALRLSGR